MSIFSKIQETYRSARETFGNLTLGHEAEFNEQIDLTKVRVSRSEYDTINITEVESGTIEQIVAKMRNYENLVNKIILNNFIFRLKDSAGVELDLMVHCYHKKSSTIDANDNKRYRRFVDFYLLGENGDIYNICQIVLIHNKFPIRYQVRRVAYRHGKRLTVYRAGAIDRYRILKQNGKFNSPLDSVVESVDSSWGKMAEYALYHYLFVLHEMTNCPERFVESKDGERRMFKGINVLPPQPKAVKPVRTVILTTPVQSEQTNTRAINCPYWTVRGHYRTLKSGKKVWVSPYAKGKERNNPELIVAKTYNLSRKE